MTTEPRPFTANDRSMASRAPPLSPRARRASTRSRSATSSARSSSSPSPVTPLTATTGAPASRVRATRAPTAAATSATRPASTTSVFVTATSPSAIPIASSSSRCSTVWALGPSSAATTSSDRVDLPGAHQHVADEPVVARHVDEVQDGPVGQRQVRVPHVDRHAAAALLREAVGVDAGQGAQERGLAVVDVAGRADDDGHPGSRLTPAAGRCPRSGARSSRRGTGARSAGRTRPRRPRPAPGSGPGPAAGPPPRAMARWPAPRPRTRAAPGRAANRRPPGERSSTTRASARSAMDGRSPRIHSARARSSAGSRAIVRHTGMSSAARPAR